MKILSFDPGPANLGWAVITTSPLTRIKHGVHHIDSRFPEVQRMGIIYRFVHDQIVFFTPDVVVVEDCFSYGRVFSMKDVVKVIALVQLACDDLGVNCELLSPTEWQARIIEGKVSRERAARKLQVGEALRGLIDTPISSAGKAEHENDALAIAVAFTLPSPVKKTKKAKSHDMPIRAFLARDMVVEG